MWRVMVVRVADLGERKRSDRPSAPSTERAHQRLRVVAVPSRSHSTHVPSNVGLKHHMLCVDPVILHLRFLMGDGAANTDEQVSSRLSPKSRAGR